MTTVKDEGPNILEWVAHHRLCGFDHTQVYQNDSTDFTIRTLRVLDRLGIIEFHNNKNPKGAHQITGLQARILERGARQIRLVHGAGR